MFGVRLLVLGKLHEKNDHNLEIQISFHTYFTG